MFQLNLRVLSAATLAIFVTQMLIAQDQANILDTELVGSWTIDLRPTADAPAYLQKFIITTITEDSLTGTFYGSNIQNANLNRNWDKLYFAFTTSDSTYDYYHSGYYTDGRIIGISHCPGRGLLQPWAGNKE